MNRRIFFSLFFASGSMICGNAGFWQLRRKKWKEDLIETRQKYINSDPIEVSVPLPEDDMSFRPVTVTGKFDHTKEMLILRSYRENNGYRVITPFFIDNNIGFLVNRGWIPYSNKDLRTRKESYEKITISGIMREGESGSKYTPKNSPFIKEWHFIELPLMASHAGLSNSEASKYVIQEIDWQRSTKPYLSNDISDIPVKSVKSDLVYWYVMPYTHASYAAFWFATSAFCFLFSILSLRR